MTTLSRSYNPYSDIQRTDDIEVILPQKAEEKLFELEEKVKLVNKKLLQKFIKLVIVVLQNTFYMLTTWSKHKKERT